MAQNPTILTTTADVIKALGGIDAVARLTGRGYSAACNWVGFRAFPSNTFELMKGELLERGFDAPSSLWSQTPKPAEAVSA